MSITVEKTWNVYRGLIDGKDYVSLGSADNNNRGLMWVIKEGLKSGAGGWTVVGSSDSTTAAMDATDRWTDWTKLVWGTGSHSWIVLKQTGINNTGSDYQICIDCFRVSTNTEYCTIVASWSAGFTGGSVTARPTATDETTSMLSDSLWGGNASTHTYRAWVAKSSDGECTRVFMSSSLTPAHGVWMIEKPKNPLAGWTTPVISMIYATLTYASIHNAAHVRSKIYFDFTGTASSGFYVTCQAIGIGALTENVWFRVPDVEGNWLFLPLGVAADSATYPGRWGEIYDMWFAPIGLPSGEYVKAGGDAWDLVVYNNVLQPWDGTVMDLLV